MPTSEQGAGSSERRPGFRLRGDRRGAAYVLAVTSLLVGLILALAMIRASGAYFTAEDTRHKKRAAANLAEAGIDYAFWQVHYNGAKLPYSADVTLPNGRFHVDAVDDGAREQSTLYVTSTGTCGSHSYTTKRVTLGLLPFNYAWCENRNADDADAVICSGTGRGVRANGRIYFGSWYTNVSNGAWATTSIYTPGTITPQYVGSPSIRFPSVDEDYYSRTASIRYYGDTAISSLSYPGSNKVVFVYGNAYIKGSYNGAFTVAASGSIYVNGPLTRVGSTSYLALVSDYQIEVWSAATVVEALMYCHNSWGGGTIALYGAKTVTGSISADDITTESSTTVSPSSRLNLDVFRQLHLPGV